jgi:predicted acetyltransferase
MLIAVQRAEREQEEVLRRLLQLYAYDFSEILGLEIDADGRFTQPALEPYWTDPRHEAFFIRADGRLAGFALVRQGSRLSSDADVWDMEEFFVMRRHRRSGVGSESARQIFDAHRGKWEVRQRRENGGARSFWRAVIAAYSGAAFTEAELDDERWRGSVQSFVTPH